jgi:hypothetical protein
MAPFCHTYGKIADASTAATASRSAPVGVTLNDNKNGLWSLEGGLNNAATLLHELGHAYTGLWGLDASDIVPDSKRDDPSFPKKSLDNNTTIVTDCLKGL